MARQYLTSIDLNKNQLLNAAIQTLATQPANPVVGQFYFDTTAGTLRQWNGTIWLDYVNTELNALITAVGNNLTVNSQTLNLGDKVVITDVNQTLSNKTLGSSVVLGADLSAASAYKVTNLAQPTSNQDAATKKYVDDAVVNLVNGAPALLDTLKELADAIANDPNFATTITTSLAGKVAKAGDTMTGALTLSGDPTANLQAATKQYVDNSISTAITATKYAANNPALSAVSGIVTWVVTHSLNSSDVVVQFRNVSSKSVTEVDVTITDANHVTLSWVSTGEVADTYRVVVLA